MKNAHLIFNFLWLFFLIVGTTFGFPSGSEMKYAPFQSGTPNDTTIAKVEVLNELAEEALSRNDILAALDYSQQAVDLASEIGYHEGEITGLMNLAKARKDEKKYDVSIKHYFEALEKAQSRNRNQDIAKIYIEIGLLYRKWNTPQKALEYFEKAHGILGNQSDVENINLLRYIAFIHLNLQNYEKSLEYHERMLRAYKDTQQQSSVVITLRSVANIYEMMGMHQQALLRNMEILEIKKASNDQEGVANYLNDIGYLYQKMKSYKPALRFFREALAKNRELGKPEKSNVVILRNIGVIEHSLGNSATALDSYEEALHIVEAEGDVEGVASSCNYISSIYMEQRNFSRAEEYTLRAVKLAEKKNTRKVLLKSYQRLTKIYELTYKTKKAYDYYRKYQELKNEISKEEIARLKLQAQRQKKVDAMEEKVKQSIADKEVAQIRAKRLEAENAQKEQRLRLLEQEQALQNNEIERQKLEKEKSEKESSLLKQKLRAQAQEQRIATIQKNQELKNLETEQKEKEQSQKQALLEQELKTAYELEEKNKQILQDEQKIKQYYNIFIGLFGIIFLLVAISFYYKQKAHKKIKAQAFELQEKNDELQEQREEILQKNEELHAQKEEIFVQKDRIERSYVNMGIISKIGQKVTATLDMQEIMRIVYQDVKALMPADRFGIGKYNEKVQKIEYQYYVDNGEEVDGVTVATSGERLAGWVIRNYGYVFINDMQNEYKRYIKNLSEYPKDRLPESIICIPLAIKGKVIGLINVQSKNSNAYEKYHLDMLQTLANYVSIAVYNSDVYGSLKNANNIIAEKNKHITDSIRYAQTIQQAVLPNVHDFEAFTDNFVLFLPKDIVSGDFYWVHVDGRTTYVAAVDCTGHGVPGAFMSMLGNDILDEAVSSGVTNPPEILETLHQRIFERLDQKSGTNDDGMDVCLCKITYPEDNNNQVDVVFAGAKRPLFYCKDKEIKEVKGSNKAIGGNYKNNKTFIGFPMTLQKGDILYLTTDGYIDQNNVARRKFGTTRFVKMLNEIHGQEMSERRTTMNTALQNHQETEEQRDDITVIGIKL